MLAASEWISQIAYTIYQDKDDLTIADELRTIDQQLCKQPDMYSVIFDQLSSMRVISKAQYRAYLDLRDPRL